MIGLLVTGHANFGSGITSSVNLIAGEQEAYKYVDFLPTYSTEDLTGEITKALDELKDCEAKRDELVVKEVINMTHSHRLTGKQLISRASFCLSSDVYIFRFKIILNIYS